MIKISSDGVLPTVALVGSALFALYITKSCSKEVDTTPLSSAAVAYSQAKVLDAKLSSTEARISSGYAVVQEKKKVFNETLKKVTPDEKLGATGSIAVGDSIDKLFFSDLPKLLSE